MAANGNLHRAKRAKNDEFYTQIHDIEDELVHYRDHFRDKVVLCNCDDPETSMFWVFFFLQFADPLGLRKLIATHYDPERPSYKLEYDGTGEPVRTPLEGNGDFRSPECLALMDEADIVVTNPPFSLFREFVATLEEHHKQYLIIGNLNAITYKEVFPLIKENRLWMGYTRFHGGATYFIGDASLYDPEKMSNPKNAYIKDGKLYWRVNGVRWFTNLTHSKRNEELFLYRHYDPETYPHYDNYDAIEVGHVCDIPCDWDGVMGVPISFLDVYNPDQFEIVGLGNGAELFGPTKTYINARMIKNGKESNGNAINRVLVYPAKGTEKVLYKADNVDGYLFAPYARILIRNRKPERPQEATEGVA